MSLLHEALGWALADTSSGALALWFAEIFAPYSPPKAPQLWTGSQGHEIRPGGALKTEYLEILQSLRSVSDTYSVFLRVLQLGLSDWTKTILPLLGESSD